MFQLQSVETTYGYRKTPNKNINERCTSSTQTLTDFYKLETFTESRVNQTTVLFRTFVTQIPDVGSK